MKKILFMLVLFVFVYGIYGKVKPASLFTNNMVLQRNKIISIWGKADSEEKVTVKFNGQSETVITNNNGDWFVKLQPMKEGGPFELIIEGKNQIILKNILIGEVWIASGQSNMELALSKTENAEEEIANANYPLIRLFIVKHNVAETPQNFCKGNWVECSPKTVKNFSAAAYYFGKKLSQELNVPIGIIQSTWGGTAAECWIPKEVLENEEDFKPILTRWEEKIKRYPEEQKEYDKIYPAAYKQWQLDSAKAISNGMAPPRSVPRPDGPGSRNTPTGLFNGMIQPLIPFTIEGIIWYQGEANASRAYQYRRLFPALIESWRKKWGLGNIPFYFVQLPNLFREQEPSKSGWAELREAQLLTLSLPNTGMAVTIDIGDPMNLHPKNKKDVGLRLAIIALAKNYGRNVIYSGPIYKYKTINKNEITLSFGYVGDSLLARNSEVLKGFVICGNDKKFVKANAKIEGNKVIVWNDEINEPIEVRYNWEDNPDGNLYNSAMLPASPFRTDDWPEVTFGRK